jgi:hypothetical protein
MNIAELQKILAEHGVRSRAYSIEGSGDDEEQYRLEKDGLLWIFYYYERGNKVGVREFLTEDEACIYFLKILLDDSTTRR